MKEDGIETALHNGIWEVTEIALEWSRCELLNKWCSVQLALYMEKDRVFLYSMHEHTFQMDYRQQSCETQTLQLRRKYRKPYW